MTRPSLLYATVLALLAWPGAAPAAQGAELHVAVASNFATTLRDISRMFEAETGHVIVPSSGSTGKLYTQIRNGAPFDALLAADMERPRLLDDAGLTVPGSRFTYAVGRLVLWSPDPDLVAGDGQVLSSGRWRRLAIANPNLAPYGRAARETLERLGLWKPLRERVVTGENIAQAWLFVRSGNAELGLVAAAQTQAVPADAGSRWYVPQDFHSPIEQQAVLLTDSPAGRTWMRFLKSDTARRAIRKAGYEAGAPGETGLD